MKLIMTIEHFVNFTKFFSKPFKFNGLLGFLLTIAVSSSPTGAFAQDQQNPVQNPELVGEVSLVLGKVYIESPERGRRQVEAGSPVRVRDQIITGANGHVHIRFVDQALISVRPDSQLEVVRYQYDARHPDQSAVKFNLVEGVTRSISGDAARSARQRFRLNTPIAAIGVRGTDFVVSASPETVRALVNEGTIVMAPYSDECSADEFGPCAINAIELTGESLQIVEFNADTPSATPATHERNLRLLRDEVQLVIADTSSNNEVGEAEDKSVGSEVYLEGVTSRKVAADAQQVARTEKEPVPEPEPVEPEPIVDFTPAAPVSSVVLTDRQLVWGRWSWADGQGELERITLAYDEASAGREVTVNRGEYALFRSEGDQVARVDRNLSVVGFQLSSAQAFYSSASGIVAMHVSGGSLNIDFDDQTFATELNLDHAITGPQIFSAMGRIYSGGYFYDRSETQNIKGAVSLDGREAGYYFDKQLESGGIQGLTLWDSQ